MPCFLESKIMADLDIAEKRRPQDGRIRVSDGHKTIDIRVSSLPTDFGEKEC
jgi:type IV pilus assembly protein PilB